MEQTPIQTAETPPKNFWERNRTLVKVIGWILIVTGLSYLFIVIDDANSPARALGTDEIAGSDITSLWSNFAFVAIPLLLGMGLVMKKVNVGNIVLTGIGIFVVMFISSIGGTYNSITYLDQDIQKQASDVKITYQLRLDTVPDLLNVAREPLSQEKEIQDKLISARSSLVDATSANNVIDSANHFEQSLGRVTALIESYPELRETTEFQNVQKAINDTGDKLATQRLSYNEKTGSYNMATHGFPMLLFSGMFHFKTYDYWSDVSSRL